MARFRSIVSSVAAGLLLASVPALAGPAQADPAAPVLILPAVASAGVTTQGETFASKDVWVRLDAGSAPSLAGLDGGTLYVDDAVDVKLCDAATGACATVFSNDFSAACTSGISPAGPFDLASVLPASGVAHLQIAVRDVCGGVEYSSDIALSGVTVLPGDPGVDDTPCVKKPAKFPAGITGRPEYTASAGAPTVVDGKLQGTGTVDVTAKNNCSTQVKVSLETYTCKADGTACGAKTLKAGAWANAMLGTNSATVTATCRTGVKKYRVQVAVRWVQRVDGALVKQSESLYGADEGWVSLHC